MTDTAPALHTPRFFGGMIGRLNFSVRFLTIYFVVIFPINYDAKQKAMIKDLRKLFLYIGALFVAAGLLFYVLAYY